MLVKVCILILALVVAALADGSYERRGKGGYGKLVKVKNIWERTIVEPTRKHYRKKVRSSKSRKDKWEEINTRTQTNIGQKVVSSDLYVKDNVKIEYPLKVLNVEHHNRHLTVKNVYPKHINTYVNRWKKIIKPQEGRTDSYSNSESREKIVHKTQVQNREKEVNSGTQVLPTQWVSVSKRYNNKRNNENNNNGYRSNNGNKNNAYQNNNKNEDDWENDK